MKVKALLNFEGRRALKWASIQTQLAGNVSVFQENMEMSQFRQTANSWTGLVSFCVKENFIKMQQ